VVTGVVDAWERMLESRFACSDFDVAAALLHQVLEPRERVCV